MTRPHRQAPTMSALMQKVAYADTSNITSNIGVPFSAPDIPLQHRSPVFCAGYPPGGCVFSNPLRK
jgi:hypothetical protein